MGTADATQGRRVASLFLELIRLRFSRGRLGKDLYHRLGAYDDRLFTVPWNRFLTGNIKKKLGQLLNHKHWHAVANDKITFYTLMQGMGLPYPRLYAVYHPGGRYTGLAPCLTSPDQLEEFLEDGIQYPFFTKPVWGRRGLGALAVRSLDRGTKRLVLASGEKIAVRSFIDSIRTGPLGHHQLFQAFLDPHPDTIRMVGPLLSSVRAIVLLMGSKPELVSATWRIAGGQNMTDNFSEGSAGNLLCTLDLSDGSVVRAFQRVGKAAKPVERHLQTGIPLAGAKVPDWQALVRYCLAASSAFPGIRFQHWDLALSRDGPVFLELNALGDFYKGLFYGRIVRHEKESAGPFWGPQEGSIQR